MIVTRCAGPIEKGAKTDPVHGHVLSTCIVLDLTMTSSVRSFVTFNQEWSTDTHQTTVYATGF